MEQLTKTNSSNIYCIKSPHTYKFYVGVTIQSDLSETLLTCKSVHETYNYKKKNNKETIPYLSYFEIIDFGDAYIELLENIEYKNKAEVNKRRDIIILQNRSNCVNKNNLYKSLKYYNNEDENVQQKCDCGGKYKNKNSSEHFKTKMHIEYYKTKNIVL